MLTTATHLFVCKFYVRYITKLFKFEKVLIKMFIVSKMLDIFMLLKSGTIYFF